MADFVWEGVRAVVDIELDIIKKSRKRRKKVWTLRRGTFGTSSYFLCEVAIEDKHQERLVALYLVGLAPVFRWQSRTPVRWLYTIRSNPTKYRATSRS